MAKAGADQAKKMVDEEMAKGAASARSALMRIKRTLQWKVIEEGSEITGFYLQSRKVQESFFVDVLSLDKTVHSLKWTGGEAPNLDRFAPVIVRGVKIVQNTDTNQIVSSLTGDANLEPTNLQKEHLLSCLQAPTGISNSQTYAVRGYVKGVFAIKDFKTKATEPVLKAGEVNVKLLIASDLVDRKAPVVGVKLLSTEQYFNMVKGDDDFDSKRHMLYLQGLPQEEDRLQEIRTNLLEREVIAIGLGGDKAPNGEKISQWLSVKSGYISNLRYVVIPQQTGFPKPVSAPVAPVPQMAAPVTPQVQAVPQSVLPEDTPTAPAPMPAVAAKKPDEPGSIFGFPDKQEATPAVASTPVPAYVPPGATAPGIPTATGSLNKPQYIKDSIIGLLKNNGGASKDEINALFIQMGKAQDVKRIEFAEGLNALRSTGQVIEADGKFKMA